MGNEGRGLVEGIVGYRVFLFAGRQARSSAVQCSPVQSNAVQCGYFDDYEDV